MVSTFLVTNISHVAFIVRQLFYLFIVILWDPLWTSIHGHFFNPPPSCLGGSATGVFPTSSYSSLIFHRLDYYYHYYYYRRINIKYSPVDYIVSTTVHNETYLRCTVTGRWWNGSNPSTIEVRNEL